MSVHHLSPLTSRFRRARFELAISFASRRLDCSDVDLFHLQHGIDRALGDSGIGDRFRQSDRRDLPGQSPFVLAPAAHALLTTVADDRVIIAIRFGLINGCDLKRERFAVLELKRREGSLSAAPWTKNYVIFTASVRN